MENINITKIDAEKSAKKITKAAKEKAVLQADYEAKVLSVNRDYGTRIKKLEEVIATESELIKTWAMNNPEEFAASKTIELAGVEVAYRDGVPKVEILESWSEAKVIASLSKAGRDAWIRVKPTLDKTAIKKDYNAGETDDKELRKYGLAIIKTPTVSVDVQNLITA